MLLGRKQDWAIYIGWYQCSLNLGVSGSKKSALLTPLHRKQELVHKMNNGSSYSFTVYFLFLPTLYSILNIKKEVKCSFHRTVRDTLISTSGWEARALDQEVKRRPWLLGTRGCLITLHPHPDHCFLEWNQPCPVTLLTQLPFFILVLSTNPT